MKKKQKLNPNFISGFTDGEASFFIGIRKNPKLKGGWRVEACFYIGLHAKDQVLLESIKSFFGVGNVVNKGKDMIQYRVTTLKDLTVIIDHFEKYPLITQKKADYLLFKQVIYLMNLKEHLTQDGLNKIVAIKTSMNLGLSTELKAAFPNIIPAVRPLVENQSIVNPQWVAGFTTAEGCFMIQLLNSSSNRISYVSLVFQITQHSRDEQLMRSLIDYFSCGKVYKRNDAYDFRVFKHSDLTNKIIPFFQNYPIQGVKHRDYLDLCKAADLIQNKAHLTSEGFDKILIIKSGMNIGRDHNSI